ncbi:uncharacterized protein TRAVEDRAFT_74833 [Trametes versicolor FP-101664 SS1]|uniref:uncharacterized protein n=1 Tax=Trametes versicolor (strain FP-101664) TaxID=717944 RepID=UPI00046222C8|nr:uncharacterized protein TRAVEDRAFT_74833 [Trametes versicolor FP-101664 SS1]EIW53568.1 hypothetical protein TRAVEDRAFT_74833 [Trametes versicolor FP-101664 SS1]
MNRCMAACTVVCPAARRNAIRTRYMHHLGRTTTPAAGTPRRPHGRAADTTCPRASTAPSGHWQSNLKSCTTLTAYTRTISAPSEEMEKLVIFAGPSPYSPFPPPPRGRPASYSPETQYAHDDTPPRPAPPLRMPARRPVRPRQPDASPPHTISSP